jgi:hypothetical protein
LGCRCPVTKGMDGRLKMECNTGPGRADLTGWGCWGWCWDGGFRAAKDPPAPPPSPFLSIGGMESTPRPPPPKSQLPEHLHLCGLGYLPTHVATTLEARLQASMEETAAASCIHIISTVSNRQSRSAPSFLSISPTYCGRFSSPAVASSLSPSADGARSKIRTDHGGWTQRRGTGPPFVPRARRNLVAARTVAGARFSQDSRSQVSAFFSSSHHITWVSSRLFLRALARWSVDPIQPAGQRALIGSSYPTLSGRGRGFRGGGR